MGPDGPSMLRDRPRGRRIGVPGGAGFGSLFILMKLGLTLIRVNPNCPAARGSARQSVGVRRHRMPCCAPTRGSPQRVHGAPTPRRATSERQRMGDGSRPSSLSKSTSRSKSDPAAVIYDNSYLSSVTGAAPSRPSSLGRISPSGGAACRAPLRARSARVSGVRATALALMAPPCAPRSGPTGAVGPPGCAGGPTFPPPGPARPGGMVFLLPGRKKSAARGGEGPEGEGARPGPARRGGGGPAFLRGGSCKTKGSRGSYKIAVRLPYKIPAARAWTGADPCATAGGGSGLGGGGAPLSPHGPGMNREDEGARPAVTAYTRTASPAGRRVASVPGPRIRPGPESELQVSAVTAIRDQVVTALKLAEIATRLGSPASASASP